MITKKFSQADETTSLQNIQHIFFDLDGTLTDPKQGILNSIFYALDKMKIVEPAPAELEQFIGPPLIQSFMQRYQLSLEDGNLAVAYYREYFSTKGLFENVPYAGIHQVLEDLSFLGLNLYLATSKPTVFAKQILDHFQLTPYFKDVAGSNLDNTRTDKTEIISHLLEKWQLNPAKCLMVGDRKFDLIGARNTGVTAVAVSYGFGTLEELALENPYKTIGNCTDLLQLFHP